MSAKEEQEMLWQAWVRSLGKARYLRRRVADGLSQGAFIYLVAHEIEVVQGSHPAHDIFLSLSGCVIWLLLYGLVFLFRGTTSWTSYESEQQQLLPDATTPNKTLS